MFQEKLLTWLQSKGNFFLKNNQWQIIIVLLGLSLIGAGLLTSKTSFFKDSEVQIINASPAASAEIIVEISGQVEKPGVYKLPNGSRIDDLLTVSGGLSVNANRELLDKTLNRAAKLIDGQKLYIPSIDEQTKVLSANATSAGLGNSSNSSTTSEGISQNSGNTININSASQSQLETLSGIGPAYAQKIIEGRPYSNLEELVTKKILSQKLFDKNKDLLSIY